MANTKEYKIVINGISESISAVESLNKELSNLEARIKALEGKTVGVKSSGGGSKSSSALSEEEKIQKQINQLEEKRLAYSKEIYQNYLAAKDVLKETVNEQKQSVASERLKKPYTNTMAGMKQELADIKAVMQTVDLGDTSQMDAMVKRANELNQKLKEIEQSYGQFGRNVGNYASAFDGLQKISVTINGVTREFNSAREASKTLKNELIGLEAAGQGDSDMAKQLRTELYKLQSAMDDATKSSKTMDEAMDFMESFTAMASIGQGLKGFFGIDDSEIQRSIQKLVALQNVLNGIEKLRKQMETGEGFGKIFSAGSKAIDTFVAKVTGAKITMDGLTMSTRAATVAVRGLSMALKAIGVGLALEAISLAVEGIQSLIKSLDTTKIKEEALDSEVKALNRSYEKRKELLAGNFMSGVISSEEYLARQYQIQNEYIEQQISLLQRMAELANEQPWYNGKWSPLGITGESNTGFTGQRFNGSANPASWNAIMEFSYPVNSIQEAEEAWKKLNEAVKEDQDYFSKYGEGLNDWFNSLYITVQQTEDVMKGMGNIVLSDAIGEFQELEQKFREGKISADEFAVGLKELTERMNSDEVLNSVIADLDKYIPDEEVRERIQNILTYLQQLNDEFNAVSEAQVHRWNQVRIDAMEEGAAKIAAQMAEDERHEIAQYAKTEEQKELIRKKYERKRLNELKKHNKQVSSEAKRHNREMLEAEKDLANLRIANMKEGLNKVLKQLEEERKQRLAKVEADGLLIAERQAEINILYDKKVLEAKKEWAEKVQKLYIDMWDGIYNYVLQSQRRIADIASQTYNIREKEWDFVKAYRLNKWPNIPDYGVQGLSQLSKSTQEDLKVEQDFNKSLKDIYEERSAIISDYWKKRHEDEIKGINEIYDAQTQVENASYVAEKSKLENTWSDLEKQQSKWLENRKEQIRGLAEIEEWSEDELNKKLLEAEKEYQRAATTLDEQYKIDRQNFETQHTKNLEEIEKERSEKIRGIITESFRQRLQEMRDFQTAISNLESKQPVLNFFGVTNFKQTNANNRNLLSAYQKLADELVQMKKNLQTRLDKYKITFDDFQNANRELDVFLNNLGEKMDKVKYDLSLGGQIQTFVQDIQQYLQAASQSFQQIMSAIWDAQDTQFDKQQEYLDKMNEELDKQLDKQQDIIQQHKDSIDSIEDELADARGERRQHLIDQINAEMAAQRAAQKEEQKIQKEKDALQKKEDALELKRKKAQYKRDLLQAIVNGSLAVTYAAMNTWPMPAIAMMALAASTTAAQVGIMSANKPYAKGGVLEGPSHKQGGIPVGNTGIEVEGREYVVRKKSTTPNVQLLDMINKSERKLTLDDFIDFYSTGRIKKTISSISPNRTFAEGGTIPTISNNYGFDDRLLSAFEDYSNRPVVVSVTDINNRQAAVKNVQVLAGLTD